MTSSSSCSLLLGHRLLLLPFAVPGVRVSNRPRTPILFHRTLRRLNVRSASSVTRWRITCFRQEDDCSETHRPEFIEDISQGDVVEPEIGVKPDTSRKYWFSSFREAADSLRTAIGKQWTVPWSAETILQVMVLWISSFWFIGSWVIPFLAHVSGFSKESLTYRGQALYSLLTDVTEGLAGVAILHRCLSRFYPLPKDWFRFSLKGNWQIDVVLGCFLFPLVNKLSQFNLDLLPLMPSTPITLSSVEQSILARDPVAMALYALVVSVCAPVWEEIVFRGFLLPSLTKYMPVWGAILVSSVAFALAHFNVQRMLPLIFLGVVMGVVFARSRNLLPSMLLHSLWNGFVFLDLMK
uniref:CAAX prenyl protease 2/Lysostaphin resistance protein A-like domain-containing protein n=1 Tax=Kalanchoe fedtschenkoi TaxID=63787 RepID=A0A7N1A9G7_KALFE